MIEYNVPVSGGTSLTYPLAQITVSVTNARLKNLHTSPYEILGPGYNYVVINAYLDYKNTLCNSTAPLWIGYEALLAVNVGSGFCFFDTNIINTHNGNFGCGTVYGQTYISNSQNNQPLVLWQSFNDGVANYAQFDLTITYLQFN